MISFAKIRAYFLRVIGCIAVVAIICGICFALRSAIVDYQPIKLSLHIQSPQEQNIKIFYTNNSYEQFSEASMQPCHINRSVELTIVNCELQKVSNIEKLKMEFSPSKDPTVITGITVSSSQESKQLADLTKFKTENTQTESVTVKNITFTSDKINPSIIFQDTIGIASPGKVWFFPVNTLTCSLLALFIFMGFWWLLSVISVINKDIEESLVKKESK